MVDYKAQGKKNRALGSDTELRVRADLELKGWIVDKWGNNVNLTDDKLVKVKNAWRGVGIPMMLGGGFPDFISFKKVVMGYELIGVECKANGILDKVEKEKCKWLLDHNVFSKILVASRDKIKNKVLIKYKEFGEISK